jgi:hypothetical protein
MMRIQPAFEGTIFFAQIQDLLRVHDRRIDLETIANNTCIFQETGTILFTILRDLLDLEPMISLTEVIRFLEDRDP